MSDETHESRAPKIHTPLSFDGEVNSNTNELVENPASFL